MLVTLLILARANGLCTCICLYTWLWIFRFKKKWSAVSRYICNLIIHNIVSYHISYKLKRRFRSTFLEIDFSLLPRWKASDNSPSETLLNYRFSPRENEPLSQTKKVLKKNQNVLKSCHENKGPNPACFKPYEKKR